MEKLWCWKRVLWSKNKAGGGKNTWTDSCDGINMRQFMLFFSFILETLNIYILRFVILIEIPVVL